MPEFLLELFSEEIPARMQVRAAEELKRLATDKLQAANLAWENAESYVTPRRLALVVDGLPDKQPDVTKETKGPKVGAPEKAVDGFLRANGLGSAAEAEQRETEKGTFYFAVKHEAGRPTPEVLGEIAAQLPHELAWPKSMRWAETTLRWVRPLHGVLALFDGRPIEGRVDLGRGAALEFGDTTRGHPFLAPEPFQVSGFEDYRRKLEAAKVVLSFDERRERIRQQADALANAEGLSVKDDPGLLAEVAGLVEWPVVLAGTIDAPFMELPPEVLTVSMRTHQKYFALQRRDGGLANRFLVVANMETPDHGAAIVAGNERVLRARLADAQFFWDQDRKTPLAERVPELEQVVFHAKLGTLHDKVERMQALAADLAGRIAGGDRDKARSAAQLAKADLLTGMVDEFPELQGLMGSYYAQADGEAPEVVQAVAEHYSPLGPNDACPGAPTSVAVALADKLDTLTGFFAIQETPTGSKDPYALRRAALGAIRLIVDNDLRLPLRQVFAEALRLQPQSVREGASADALTGQLLAFLTDRLKVVLRDRGVRHDLIAAVFAVEMPDGGPEDDLVRLLARVDALERFLESDDGANLLVAYRRAANIVRIEEKKDKARYYKVERGLFADDVEGVLWDNLGAVKDANEYALKREVFDSAMEGLSQLRNPVDKFFETVMVNTDDPEIRKNRLALLNNIVLVMDEVADFSQIEG